MPPIHGMESLGSYVVSHVRVSTIDVRTISSMVSTIAARALEGGWGEGGNSECEKLRKCGGKSGPSRLHPRSATASKYWLLPLVVYRKYYKLK